MESISTLLILALIFVLLAALVLPGKDTPKDSVVDEELILDMSEAAVRGERFVTTDARVCSGYLAEVAAALTKTYYGFGVTVVTKQRNISTGFAKINGGMFAHLEANKHPLSLVLA